MSALPVEVLTRILSFLPVSGGQLHCFRQIARHFRAASFEVPEWQGGRASGFTA
jgi:hypothetical protein